MPEKSQNQKNEYLSKKLHLLTTFPLQADRKKGKTKSEDGQVKRKNKRKSAKNEKFEYLSSEKAQSNSKTGKVS